MQILLYYQCIVDGVLVSLKYSNKHERHQGLDLLDYLPDCIDFDCIEVVLKVLIRI